MQINRHALLVLSDSIPGAPMGEQTTNEAILALHDAILHEGLEVRMAESLESGQRMAERSPDFGVVLVCSNLSEPSENRALGEVLKALRSRSPDLPIFLLSEGRLRTDTPLDILTGVNEYVDLYSETSAFTANRIRTAAARYGKGLLPPYFKTLKSFTEAGDYYWDCPGHMGGMAYLKHPVGAEFIRFFGENMMRADIGVATAEMGDYLIHAGPSKQSEDIAAKLFGAKWTFYGVAGSSGSNKIVAQGAVGANEIAVVDRNCHKSLNHGLTLCQGRPVYLVPSRNGYGLIGPIPLARMKKAAIKGLIQASPLAVDAVSQEPTYAVVTNCTYDGFCYNVQDVVGALGASVPRIHFDEAWYAYAKFHPLYQDRFAMDIPEDMPDRPTIFAVQSTHKMLPALSMSSMIHVRPSPRAPLDYDDFNESFMIHGTTSPFYPIIASIDVAVSMMQGDAGRSLVQESIEEAIAFRQAVVQVGRAIDERDGDQAWFFNVLQPTEVTDPATGKVHAFGTAPIDLLSHNPEIWRLRPGEDWHGFADEDIAGTDCMLDPVKVSITCPGITPQGKHLPMGMPGCIVSKFLDDRRVEVARTGDYTLLILFSVGITRGKWGALIESLLEFKRLYDTGALALDAIPSLKSAGSRYEGMTLKALCDEMHKAMDDLQLMHLGAEAVRVLPEPVLSPAEAYQKVVRYRTERVKVSDFAGRIAANMLVPYPPGIPVLMPGERLPLGDTGITGYLAALEAFDRAFPLFEHEIQGVHIDQDGTHWVKAIIEDDAPPVALPDHVVLRRHANSVFKKGRH